MSTYAPLAPMVEPYLTFQLADLPDDVRHHVEKMPFKLWDHISPEQRRQYARTYDAQNDPSFELERVAGWLEAAYDARTWWLAESVAPMNAAMLLSGHNPVSGTLEGASRSTNPEMGPEDLKRLLFTFEGAGSPKTLKEWGAYARSRGLKIHSWLADWERWVAEVDGRNSAYQIAAALPEPHKPKSLRQEELILQCIQSKGLDPQRLPTRKNGHAGIKAEIWKTVQPNRKILLSRKTFDTAWQRLRDAGQIGESG